MAQGFAATQRWGKNSKRKESMSGDTGGAPSQTPRTSLVPSSSSQEATPTPSAMQDVVREARLTTAMEEMEARVVTRVTGVMERLMAAQLAALIASRPAVSPPGPGLGLAGRARPANDTWAQGRTPPSDAEDDEEEEQA